MANPESAKPATEVGEPASSDVMLLGRARDVEANTIQLGDEQAKSPLQAAPERKALPNRRRNETVEFDRDGIQITMTVGFRDDGAIGEVFLNADRSDSMIDVLLSDAAIIASVALQYGVPLRELSHAIKRDRFGIASSPIGAALDHISPAEARDEIRSHPR